MNGLVQVSIRYIVPYFLKFHCIAALSIRDRGSIRRFMMCFYSSFGRVSRSDWHNGIIKEFRDPKNKGCSNSEEGKSTPIVQVRGFKWCKFVVVLQFLKEMEWRRLGSFQSQRFVYHVKLKLSLSGTAEAAKKLVQQSRLAIQALCLLRQWNSNTRPLKVNEINGMGIGRRMS